MLIACANVGKREDPNIRIMLEGKWTRRNGLCHENSISISFNQKGDKLNFDSPKGYELGDNIKRKHIVYIIEQDLSMTRLRTHIVGEPRTNLLGRPVKWDLLLISIDRLRFCSVETLRCSPSFMRCN